MTRKAINFLQKFKLFDEQWSPKVIAEMNDYQFKIVKLHGDFIWHDHKNTDETFIVIEGNLRIDFRDGSVNIAPAQMFVVPKGVEHKPYAREEVMLFRTLADPTRRAIFERLCREGEQTVAALTARSGVSQPAVSKPLGLLKRANRVRDRHEGRQTHYSAQLNALAPLIDWTSRMTGFWQSRFDQLEDLLKRMDQ